MPSPKSLTCHIFLFHLDYVYAAIYEQLQQEGVDIYTVGEKSAIWRFTLFELRYWIDRTKHVEEGIPDSILSTVEEMCKAQHEDVAKKPSFQLMLQEVLICRLMSFFLSEPFDIEGFTNEYRRLFTAPPAQRLRMVSTLGADARQQIKIELEPLRKAYIDPLRGFEPIPVSPATIIALITKHNSALGGGTSIRIIDAMLSAIGPSILAEDMALRRQQQELQGQDFLDETEDAPVEDERDFLDEDEEVVVAPAGRNPTKATPGRVSLGGRSSASSKFNDNRRGSMPNPYTPSKFVSPPMRTAFAGKTPARPRTPPRWNGATKSISKPQIRSPPAKQYETQAPMEVSEEVDDSEIATQSGEEATEDHEEPIQQEPTSRASRAARDTRASRAAASRRGDQSAAAQPHLPPHPETQFPLEDADDEEMFPNGTQPAPLSTRSGRRTRSERAAAAASKRTAASLVASPPAAASAAPAASTASIASSSANGRGSAPRQAVGPREIDDVADDEMVVRFNRAPQAPPPAAAAAAVTAQAHQAPERTFDYHEFNNDDDPQPVVPSPAVSQIIDESLGTLQRTLSSTAASSASQTHLNPSHAHTNATHVTHATHASQAAPRPKATTAAVPAVVAPREPARPNNRVERSSNHPNIANATAMLSGYGEVASISGGAKAVNAAANVPLPPRARSGKRPAPASGNSLIDVEDDVTNQIAAIVDGNAGAKRVAVAPPPAAAPVPVAPIGRPNRASDHDVSALDFNGGADDEPVPDRNRLLPWPSANQNIGSTRMTNPETNRPLNLADMAPMFGPGHHELRAGQEGLAYHHGAPGPSRDQRMQGALNIDGQFGADVEVFEAASLPTPAQTRELEDNHRVHHVPRVIVNPIGPNGGYVNTKTRRNPAFSELEDDFLIANYAHYWDGQMMQWAKLYYEGVQRGIINGERNCSSVRERCRTFEQNAKIVIPPSENMLRALRWR